MNLVSLLSSSVESFDVTRDVVGFLAALRRRVVDIDAARFAHAGRQL
jgi:hypothetical protein